MTVQISCVWSNFLGDGTDNNPYRPRFSDNMQVGELYAYNLVDLLSTIKAQDADLDLPSSDMVEKHSVILAGFEPRVGVVYVLADHTRIDAASLSPHYLVAWRYTLDRNDDLAATEASPIQNSLSGEATALLNWISGQTGKTTTAITSWLRNKFGVATNQEALNWITSHQRSQLISKMAEAFEIWEHANLEIV